jgi:hypothetical protein
MKDSITNGMNPERITRYNIKGFIGREQLRLKYCEENVIGTTVFNNALKEIEPDIQKVLPRFKVHNKRNFSVKEQELIFDQLGPPPGYEI